LKAQGCLGEAEEKDRQVFERLFAVPAGRQLSGRGRLLLVVAMIARTG